MKLKVQTINQKSYSINKPDILYISNKKYINYNI